MEGDQTLNNNYVEYTTVQGDTFDMLAYKAYDNEFLSHLIIQANPQYASVLKFDSGIVLKLPKITKQAASTLPPWRQT